MDKKYLYLKNFGFLNQGTTRGQEDICDYLEKNEITSAVAQQTESNFVYLFKVDDEDDVNIKVRISISKKDYDINNKDIKKVNHIYNKSKIRIINNRKRMAAITGTLLVTAAITLALSGKKMMKHAIEESNKRVDSEYDNMMNEVNELKQKYDGEKLYYGDDIEVYKQDYEEQNGHKIK